MSNTDSFVHLPHLRDRIADPHTSRYRDITYVEIDKMAHENGMPADWRRTAESRDVTRAEAMRGHDGGDLWVFAYGSLMWDPAFVFSEVRVGHLDGHQRSFCLRSELGRGSVKHPGLMAGLLPGGTCQGLVFRIERALIDRETEIIWRREMMSHSYAPSFVPVRTEQGDVEALTFPVDPGAPRLELDLDLDQSARMIAQGRGFMGTSIGYLDNLAAQMDVLGLTDEPFSALHALASQYVAKAAE